MGFVKQMKKSEARRKLRAIIESTGINPPRYVIPATDLFAKHVKWWEDNYLVRQKPSTQKTMAYHVRKDLSPKWDRYPIDEIMADKVNEWIGEPELSHLSPTYSGMLLPRSHSFSVNGLEGNRSTTQPK